MPLAILIYYSQKSIIRPKIYIKSKMPIDRIEPMFSLILLYHSTPTLPMLVLTPDIFKRNHITKYL
jgi:hypothetical protein